MTTATFYRMKLDPTERTPITIITAAVSTRCPSCHRRVHPNTIISSHARPLDVCPNCNTYIGGNAVQEQATANHTDKMRDYLERNPNRIVSFDEIRKITTGSRPYVAKVIDRVRRQCDMMIISVRGRGYQYVA